VSLRILSAGLFLLALPLAGLAQDDADEQARAAVHQFMKCFKAKDLDGVMAVVQAPWFHKGQRIIRNREEVREAFQGLFAKKEDLDMIRYDIKTVIAYEAVREAMNDDERMLIDQVLTKSDRVLLLQLEKPNKAKEIVVLLVAVKQGEAKVVGLKS
jgi:hypothetical protein